MKLFRITISPRTGYEVSFRIDEFENDGSFREVPAHFYYPDSESGEFPLVIFSHGAFGYYESNFTLTSGFLQFSLKGENDFY